MWRSSEYLCTHDISTAGTFSIPTLGGDRDRLGDPGDAVVVGQRHVVTPASAAERTTSAGCELAVGDGRVGLEIDHGQRHGSAPPRTFLTRIATMHCMRISAKADYAVRAALELAAAPDGEPVKGEKLAEAQEIPLQFLEHILLDLKHARLIRAKRGVTRRLLARPPARGDHVADVIRAVEGPLANIHDVAARGRPTTPAPPSSCATSGSPSGRTCARCSRGHARRPDGRASCPGGSTRAARRPGRLDNR